ncbi:MAG: hypothetical protein E2O61_14900 [Gammaproteobacteria bacterium]|nr:MAG: hypothetical protein E2O59_06200 [Gammaproteobacteria bacterium]TDJ31943.1 MAG: hypothetical protein E2O61_14900 [Gammaproteobacteria bacterium]
MKYLFSAILALCFSVSAIAQNYVLINGDGSKYSELCIAATVSEQALSALARKHIVYPSEVGEITCNGLLIKEFANKYQSNPSATGKSQKVFALINANGTKETKLCIAAATSNEEFSKVKSELFGKDRRTVQDISCNDLRIASFAKKHGNVEFHI